MKVLYHIHIVDDDHCWVCCSGDEDCIGEDDKNWTLCETHALQELARDNEKHVLYPLDLHKADCEMCKDPDGSVRDWPVGGYRELCVAHRLLHGFPDAKIEAKKL